MLNDFIFFKNVLLAIWNCQTDKLIAIFLVQLYIFNIFIWIVVIRFQNMQNSKCHGLSLWSRKFWVRAVSGNFGSEGKINWCEVVKIQIWNTQEKLLTYYNPRIRFCIFHKRQIQNHMITKQEPKHTTEKDIWRKKNLP